MQFALLEQRDWQSKLQTQMPHPVKVCTLAAGIKPSMCRAQQTKGVLSLNPRVGE